jgi:two-component system response regulator
MSNGEGTILMVDDNPRDLELTTRSLRAVGVANPIKAVADGAEALDYLFCRGAYAGRDPRETPVLILLDLNLPKVDGVEALRQMRADPRTALIPVVMLTSSSLEEDVVRSYQAGANSYVRKPVDTDEFHEKMRLVGLYWLLTSVAPPPRVR